MPNGWPRKGGKGGKGGKWGDDSMAGYFHQTIESYLLPLLSRSIQETLSERSDALLLRLPKVVENEQQLLFYIFVNLDEARVSVASVDVTNESSCRAATNRDEAIISLAIGRKTTLFSNIANDCAVIFNRDGERMGKALTLPPNVLDNVEGHRKWLYANPIIEVSNDVALSRQVIGVLKIDGNGDAIYDVFTNEMFQKEVDAIASDLAPYLTVLNSLMLRTKPGFQAASNSQ